jgi:hypothetical protein
MTSAPRLDVFSSALPWALGQVAEQKASEEEDEKNT